MATSGLFEKVRGIRFAGMLLAFMLPLASGCGGSNNPPAGGGPDLGTGGNGPLGPNTTLLNVFVTWYGFNDNSCQIETDHNCNTIGYSKMDGFPVRHDIATEGAGTYDDPSTFATAANDEGTMGEMLPGTLIYVPYVRKYFVMEDQCVECGDEWAQKMSYHVDLWMGPSYGSNNAALMSCEDSLTLGDGTFMGTGTIIVNPPNDLPVEPAKLFANDTCTTKTYSN